MRIRRIVALFAGVALLAGAGAALARDDEPVADWNQERVTSYAKELSEACSALKDAVAKTPTNLLPANQRSFYRAKDDVRMLTSAARGLAKSLENGEGKEETLPRFKRIELLRNDAAENGRSAMLADDVLAKVTPVGVALIKLAPYYR
ncbi:MAG: hypothetical protein JRH01_08965 [Deltaproteobacteria bacterium]|nr:hypothetical protein [Deltaproteobacteria bacterium]MBW2393106.1 hypothetical protein [Deltaproteobacteria bacterium]